MNQLSTICGASTIKNKMIFFDGHDSHYDDRVLSHMEDQYIQPLVIKLGNSCNDQPIYNGPNTKLKSHQNDYKVSWMLKYGT